MTIPFKTFSKHLTEKAAGNVSVFDGQVADKGRIFSAGDLASFGGAGWGGSNSNPKDNPMYKYFAANISNANTQTKSTLNLLRATPGLMSDVLGDGDGDEEGDTNTNGGQGVIFKAIQTGTDDQQSSGSGGYSGMTTSGIRGSSGFGDGEDDEDTDDEEDDEDDEDDEEDDEELNQIPGMNTDALYFGDPGDDETKKNIYRAALAHQKDAQARWKQLKTWVTSFGVDPKIQSKITSTTTVLGVNTPSIMKNLKKGKE
jgi:hypothetical protein